MPRKLFVSSKYIEYDEYITVSKNGLYFSAAFIKNNNLDQCKNVLLFTFDENNYKFGMEFSTEDKIEGGFALVRTGRNRHETTNACMTAARSFIQELLPLKKLVRASSTSGKKNRFPIAYDKIEKCFTFSIIPVFEYNATIDSIPDQVYGIYRYLNEMGEIIYIGKGNIKNRAKSIDRQEWGIKTVEYSILNDPEERSKYEAIHIRDFEDRKGAKPPFNAINGRLDCE